MPERVLVADFRAPLAAHWRRVAVGNGAHIPAADGLRLTTHGTSAQHYSNAQLDDYQGHARRDVLWRPPLTLMVRARFSHPAAAAQGDGGLLGTAGFGFWNDPFLMTGRRMPTLPRALWFFYASPPSDMKLDVATPGHGWKAAMLDALCWPALPLALTAPLTVPLMHLRPFYRRFWPLAQRALHIRETAVNVALTGWHTYAIVWENDAARFVVDAADVLVCNTAPRGPLGLVLWLDNQYMVVTPWGHLGHGLLASPATQWLELASLSITR